MEKQIQRETDGRGYGAMHGIPMVATSPVRHESPVGINPVEIHSYEPPWKALTDFALHTDLDRLPPPPPGGGGPPGPPVSGPPGGPQFQHLVNQMHGYPPDMPPGGPDMHHMASDSYVDLPPVTSNDPYHPPGPPSGPPFLDTLVDPRSSPPPPGLMPPSAETAPNSGT